MKSSLLNSVSMMIFLSIVGIFPTKTVADVSDYYQYTDFYDLLLLDKKREKIDKMAIDIEGFFIFESNTDMYLCSTMEVCYLAGIPRVKIVIDPALTPDKKKWLLARYKNHNKCHISVPGMFNNTVDRPIRLYASLIVKDMPGINIGIVDYPEFNPRCTDYELKNTLIKRVIA